MLSGNISTTKTKLAVEYALAPTASNVLMLKQKNVKTE